jgi:o-succinylbenzoate---CoA ligase
MMDSKCIPNFLEKRAFLTPDRTAIFFKGQMLSFKDLYERSLETAGKLTALGVVEGQFVSVLLRNHLDTVIILHSLQLLGVKAVILNNRLTAEELGWQFRDSGSAILLTEQSLERAMLRDEEGISAVPLILKEELLSTKMALPLPVKEINLDDICTVMYTSGTTGNPKGVLQSYGNHWWNAIGSALNMGLTENDCWLCAVPIYHISGFSILMRSIIYGVPIVLHESFEVDDVLADLADKKVTIMSVVSTTLGRIVDRLKEKRLPEEFRCMLLGGGPAPLSLLETCKAKGIPVFQTYGMTETSSQIVTLAPEYSVSKLGSAGKTLFPAQLKIELPDGREASPHEAGEIVVKGPNVTTGYLNRPEMAEEKIRNGWLHTGDVGYLDDEGFLYVLDRRSDLIISGGENIYPAEIEGVLLSHEAIADAGVIGISDEKWGQAPVAFLVLKNGFGLTEEDIVEFCTGRLAKFKIPKEIYFLNELPRNASKKLLRRKLREYLRE